MTFDHLTVTGRGYVTRAQFLSQGYNDRDIRSAVHAKLLLRRRHGVYVYAAEFSRLSTEQQHVIDVRSVADKLRSVAISHESACAVHGIAMYGVDLTKIHVTRLDGAAGRTEYGIVHHVGKVLKDEDLVEVDGMLVTRPARAMFEASTRHTVESAIVTLDSGLHLALTSLDELTDLGALWWNWPGSRRARFATRLADGRAESPGESRSRFLFRREGLPQADLQVRVDDEDGRLIGFSDFGWLEYHHLGEFDGKVKYGGIPSDPRTPQDIAYAEKRREDAMRAQQAGMSRWGVARPQRHEGQADRSPDRVRSRAVTPALHPQRHSDPAFLTRDRPPTQRPWHPPRAVTPGACQRPQVSWETDGAGRRGYLA
ncbi:type IV toxin-antitoxin system AbiEi family antitoxin domain-containing protein [Aeromicrobium sp. UC242_57]|uniref:type IV toxin-antitoxin system AbiEi family antitoxin domain-containing protein n=1 Tax=Aeromicrobium sp. UC242_57 TaxID=3374624 RepID=UPI0037B93B16